MNRRMAREIVMKMLFETDIGEHSPEDVFNNYVDAYKPDERSLEFIRNIYFGVLDKINEIDNIIEENAAHWKINRMAGIERNILRMATYELFYIEEIPASATINEAVDIAKKYGTGESGKFVNGILGVMTDKLENKG